MKIRSKWLEGGQYVTMTDNFTQIVESRNYQELNAVTDSGQKICYPKVDFKYYSIDVSDIGNKLYELLKKEMFSHNPDVNKLLFLTGAVHALRIACNYQVSEIEMAFQKIRKVIDKEGLEWLLMHCTV